MPFSSKLKIFFLFFIALTPMVSCVLSSRLRLRCAEW